MRGDKRRISWIGVGRSLASPGSLAPRLLADVAQLFVAADLRARTTAPYCLNTCFVDLSTYTAAADKSSKLNLCCEARMSRIGQTVYTLD